MLKAKTLLAMVAIAVMCAQNPAAAIEGPRGLFRVTSSTAAPAGQKVRFTAVVVARQNEQNFTVGFHILRLGGGAVASNFFTGLDFVAGVQRTIVCDWLVPANVPIGTRLYSAAAVFDATWLWYAALNSSPFTIGAASPRPDHEIPQAQ